MTPLQIKTIHAAANQAGLNRAQYELMLKNVGRVTTCKDLTERQFEDCMAFLEDSVQLGSTPDYWRQKVANRAQATGTADARQVHLIRELYGQYEQAVEKPYFLSSLCSVASRRRTPDVTRLHPREASALIELLKDKIARAPAPAAPPPPAPSLSAHEIPF